MNRLEHLLVILDEECKEVGQRADKALRFSLGESEPEQPYTNAQRIMHEYCDLIAMIEMLADEGAISLSEITTERIQAKKAKVEKYLLHSRKCGTLTDEPTNVKEGERG